MNPQVPSTAEQQAPPRPKRLGEILVDAGVVTEPQVQRALAVQEMGGGRMGSVLVKLKFCTEVQIRDALHEQLGVEVIELDQVEMDPSVVDLVPLEIIRKYEVLPIRVEGDALWVAMMDPYNLRALDDVRFATGYTRQVVVTCSESEFKRWLEDRLATQSVMDEILDDRDFYDRCLEVLDDDEEPDEESIEELIHDLEMASAQHPVITLCNFLLVESIGCRTSQITPERPDLRVVA